MEYDFLSNLIIKKIHSVTAMFSEADKKSKRVNRPYWAIIHKYEGETKYYCNGKYYFSNSDNMIILPKGSTYEWSCTKSGHYYCIEFDSDLTSKEILPVQNIDSEKIFKLFKEAEYKHLLKQPLYELECIKDTYLIILEMLGRQSKKYIPANRSEKLKPVMEYIAKNYNSTIKNDDLSYLAGMSTVYFRKLFTSVYGTSPINYIHKLRIKKAKEMLQSDYSSITDIALALGYTNIYDFSRDFKKHTGISPNKYAKLNSTLLNK